MLRPRSDWTPSLPKPGSQYNTYGTDNNEGLPTFRASTLKGISIHVTNQYTEFVGADPITLFDKLRKEHEAAGYSDIKYNFGVAQNASGAFVMRGLLTKGAAFLEPKLNQQYLSVFCLLGLEERPTDNLLSSLRSIRDFVLSKFPDAAATVMSNDIRKSSLTPSNKTLARIVSNQETAAASNSIWNSTPVGEDFRSYSKYTCPLPNWRFDNGSISVHVHELLEQLSYWGYYNSRNDGYFGPLAEHAVKMLQADLSESNRYHKTIDGVYEKHTREGWCSLIKDLSQMKQEQKELVVS